MVGKKVANILSRISYTSAYIIMEDKETDNIYIYNEESRSEWQQENITDSPLDTSGPNFSQVDKGSEDSDSHDKESDDGKQSPSALRLMFKVMMNPIEGWKSVRRASLTPERAQQSCFYPLLAIMAVSKFAIIAYNPSVKLPDALVDAVCSFVSFFFGYFCLLIILKTVMPEETRHTFDSNFGKVFIIISLSTLCLFYTLADLLPMLWAILIFLPLWTIYIVCRGTKFLKLPQNKQISSTFILCLLIVGVPFVLSWLLGLVLPS